MTFKNQATYLAYSTGWGAVRRMPEKSAYKNFDRVADQLWRSRGAGVRQLEKNLGRVVPDASSADLRDMSHESMRKYFRYWCDAFRIPDWSRERIVDTFGCVDEHNLSDGLASGNGVIVAPCHMGNWDHGGAWAALVHAPVTAVAERLEPERLFERFLEYRASLGMRIYPLGQPNVVDNLAQELRTEGRIVGLVSDRDLTARGIEVDFFGDKTRMPAGPANLALRTDATLVPATLWYDGPKAFAQMHDPVTIPAGAPRGDDAKLQPGYEEAISAMTQQIASAFEGGIRQRPTDWHMLQKLWLSDLDPDRLAASDAAGGR